MWIADGWKDYEVLDTSSGEKLERWGKYELIRPRSAGCCGQRRRNKEDGNVRMLIITEAKKAVGNGVL